MARALTVVGYGLPYFRRLPGGLSGELVGAAMPRLADNPDRYVLEEAVPAPTDVHQEHRRGESHGGGQVAVIRHANDKDADAITQVFLASRAAAMPYLPRLYDDEQTRAFITHVVLPQCKTWVVESPETGEILGFAALEGAMLEHLYLRPDARRQGIGTQLLEQVRKASPTGLTLRVFTRNTDARAFYERHGFRQVDENDGSRNEENEPDMTYVWQGRA